jgi:tRNA threonylcarbamoyl adenosine modification protein YeaZ
MFLCIDTSTEFSGVCITDGKKSVYLPLEARHASEKILETIDEVIQKADIQLSDLKNVVVIKGPGSFTGLRVGIAVANQFAHQLNIPIIGLQTEEWYACRSDEKDFIYLQSMNRDQIYMVGFGKFGQKYPQSILSLSECHYELVNEEGLKWMGQLNEAHRKSLIELNEVKSLRSPVDTWQKTVQDITITPRKNYDLAEPFYGKEPSITESKKKLNI